MTARKKINLKELKAGCERRGVKSIAALARQIGCSRPGIYFAIENPDRFSRLYEKILEAVK